MGVEYRLNRFVTFFITENVKRNEEVNSNENFYLGATLCHLEVEERIFPFMLVIVSK